MVRREFYYFFLLFFQNFRKIRKVNSDFKLENDLNQLVKDIFKLGEITGVNEYHRVFYVSTDEAETLTLEIFAE